MGVKNLNKLIKVHPIRKITADNLIIDGYNVVITFIQSILSSIRENPVGGNIIEIFNFIVRSISQRIHTVIKNIKSTFKCRYVYFVVDGAFQKPLELSGGNVLDIKAFEHLSRQNQLDKQKERIIRKIEESSETIEQKESEEERRFFEIGDNYRHLIYPILDSVYRMELLENLDEKTEKIKPEDEKQLNPDGTPEGTVEKTSEDENPTEQTEEQNEFQFIESHYEADYTIANLANLFSRGESRSIIMSLDTDFFVMCCENPNVFILNFKELNQVYSPFREWNRILNEIGIAFNKRLIFRLAPLFGNDYTANGTDKQGILDPSEKELKIVILKNEFPDKRKKKLTQLKSLIEYHSEILSLNSLDAAVKSFAEANEKYSDYFRKYSSSVAAYEKMEEFLDFDDYVPKNKGSKEIQELFPNPKTFIDSRFDDLLDETETDHEKETEQTQSQKTEFDDLIDPEDL